MFPYIGLGQILWNGLHMDNMKNVDLMYLPLWFVVYLKTLSTALKL
jgi:ABC-type phosphate/phosphonate transport system permease subunit